MGRIPSIALLVVGLMLIAWGLDASDSLSSTFSKTFSGSPSDKAIWLLAGGTILAVAGLFGTVRFWKD